jgi:hypothetical protein
MDPIEFTLYLLFVFLSFTWFLTYMFVWVNYEWLFYTICLCTIQTALIHGMMDD